MPSPDASKPPPPRVFGDGWRQFGHDARHTGRTDATISAKPMLVWTSPGGADDIVVDGMGRAYVRRAEVVALDTKGNVRWKHSPEPFGEGLALSPADELIVTSPDGQVRAYTQDGALVFSVTLPNGPSHFTTSRPTVGPDGRIFVSMSTEFPVGGDDAVAVHALSPAGVLLWSTVVAHDMRATPPALADDGTLQVVAYSHAYYGEMKGPATLLRLDSDGTLMSQTAFVATGGASAKVAPCIRADGSVLVPVWGGVTNLFAFTPSGDPLWTASNPGLFATTPAVDESSRVYAATAWGVWLYSASGEEIWSASVGPPSGKLSIWSQVALSGDGSVVFRDIAGGVGAVKDGQLVWYQPIEGPFGHWPVAIGPDGTIFVGGGDAVRAYR